MVMDYYLFSEQRRHDTDASRRYDTDTEDANCKFKNLLDTQLLFLAATLLVTTKKDCIGFVALQYYNPWVRKPFPHPLDQASLQETCLWDLIVWPGLIMYDDIHVLK